MRVTRLTCIDGGALNVYNAVVANCTFSSNTAALGGAIATATLWISDSQLFLNSAACKVMLHFADGGAIGASSAHILSSEMTNNSALCMNSFHLILR